MKSRFPIAIAVLIFTFTACSPKGPGPGKVLDEAKSAGVGPEYFKPASEDYFHDMDGAVQLSPAEVRGRNMWIVWTGGNDRFWDQLATVSIGSLDFLKTLSSYDPQKDGSLTADRKAAIQARYKFSRDNRFNYLGLVNEPCFDKAAGPDSNRFGLWLDKRRSDCPPDPFENEQNYPGVKIGARSKNLPVGSAYGWASGIVGLRLFPNPAFDENAARSWDPVRFYTDESYYNDKKLIRPYRVGMSCGFCHVGPDPVRPPADPENPQWANLSSNVGAQYFWIDRIFAWQADPSSFAFQFFHTSRPGALDTSLVSSDYITNPRTMNAVYNLAPRLAAARKWHKETIAGGGLNNKQFNEITSDPALTQFFEKPATVWTPMVLKEGADSVGALGALNRVYLNIGLFSEEWTQHFNPLVGGTKITPIEIEVARKNSTYWLVTETQTPDMAQFFLKTTPPHRLKDAPGGSGYLKDDAATLNRGKTVFAERCARCHSSKAPDVPPDQSAANCAGSNYLTCFDKYWQYTKTDAFKKAMRDIVMKPDFLDGNYLSNELRIPVTLLQTNACSPLASNAIGGNIWDNFSSESYKQLPAVGSVTVYHPVTGEPKQLVLAAGGRGYTRVPSLISAWSTAPFLLNNALGKFDPSPSVQARMGSFQNSIEQLLWPEKRDKDNVLADKVLGRMDRTTAISYLRVPTGYLPDSMQGLLDISSRLMPWLFTSAGVEIGPVPKGTPVSLIANTRLLSESTSLAERARHEEKLVALLLRAKSDLRRVDRSLPPDQLNAEAQKVFANLVDPFFEVSACPDYIVNRGHYFGTSKFTEEPALSDSDKNALIAFIKTF